jgi:hypothetical protein
MNEVQRATETLRVAGASIDQDSEGNAVSLRWGIHSPLTVVGLVAMTKLQSLIDVHLGDANDETLKYVSLLARLKRLDLSHPLAFGVNITDEGLTNLEQLTDLEFLNLQTARVSDAGIVHLKGLVKLTSLGISLAHVTLAGLQELQPLTALTYIGAPASLSLEYAQLFPNLEVVYDFGTKDAELVFLSGLPKLRELGVESAGVTDAGMVHVAALRTLNKLYLVDTNVSESAITSLKAIIPTCEIVH